METKFEDIINDVYKARKEVQKAKWLVENAEFRISIHGSNDEMWSRIRKEAYEKLATANKNFKEIHDKIIFLKQQCSSYEYESLLKRYGVVLGMTENIEHVQDSLFDEKDLQRALKQTSEIIQKKREEIRVVKENNDEDMLTVLLAELDYYENDMRKHHWGKERLEMLTSDIRRVK